MIWRRGLYDCNTAQGDWNSESSEHFIKNLGNLNSFSTVPFREQNNPDPEGETFLDDSL